jgi:hypothetical protein
LCRDEKRIKKRFHTTRETFEELIDDLRAIDAERGSSPLIGKIRSQIRMMRRTSLQSHKYKKDND